MPDITMQNQPDIVVQVKGGKTTAIVSPTGGATKLVQLVDVRANTLVDGGVLSYVQANGDFEFIAAVPSADQFARDHANGAFDKANTANVTGQAAFDKANGAIYTAAQIRANLSNTSPINYDSSTGIISHAASGVTATTYGNTTFVPQITVDSNGHVTGIVNTAIALPPSLDQFARDHANGAYDKANTANVTGQAAFDKANADFTLATTANTVAASAYSQANIATSNADAAFARANTANVTGQAAFDKANTDFTLATTANTVAASAYNQANIATTNADAAFTKTNTAIFTAAQIRANISNTSPINYDAATGIISHATSGVTAKTYGSPSLLPVISVDSNGHVTAVTNVAISGLPASTANGQTLIGNTVSGGFDVNTLTQGTGISITNDKGSITIAATGGSAIDQFARDNSNGAFTKANTANTTADAAFNKANSANVLAQSAYNQANIATTNADAAFTHSNAAFTLATTANTVAASAYNQANIATTNADAAFARANAAYANANSAIYTAAQIRANISNTAPINYDSTSGVISHADSTVVATTYGNTTFVPTITVDAKGHVTSVVNTAIALPPSLDQFARDHANGAYDKANTANVTGQAAFDKANSGFTLATTANTVAASAYAQANIATTNADAAFARANAAFVQANTANVTGQAAFDKANGAVQTGFVTVNIAGQANVVADSNTDVLTLVAGSNITLTTDAPNDTITISSTGGGSGADQYARNISNNETAFVYSDVAANGVYTVWTELYTAYQTAGSPPALIGFLGNPAIIPSGTYTFTAPTVFSSLLNSNYGTNVTVNFDTGAKVVGVTAYLGLTLQNQGTQFVHDISGDGAVLENSYVLGAAGKEFFYANSGQLTLINSILDANTVNVDAYYDFTLTIRSMECAAFTNAFIGGASTIRIIVDRESNVFQINNQQLFGGTIYTSDHQGMQGSTAQRPSAPANGQIYYDYTVGGPVVANNGTWKTVNELLHSTANGQLLIGNTVSGGFDVATLTQGTGIVITDDKGSITIAATGGSSIDQFARDHANGAFDKANTANVTGQAAFDRANTANVTGQAAFDKANTANVTGQAAFDKANTANVTGQAAFDKANTDFTLATTANTVAASAYAQANIATTNADAAFTRANAAYANANTAIYTAAQIRANISNTAPINYASATGIISHNTSGVVAAVYGNATIVPSVTIDTFGHITNAVNTAIQLGSTTQVGLILLEDSTISVSTTNAATSNAVNSVSLIAQGAFNLANNIQATGVTGGGVTVMYCDPRPNTIGADVLNFTLSLTPSPNVETNKGTTVNSNTRFLARFISANSFGVSSTIDAGTWDFTTYANTSSTGGSGKTSIVQRINKRYLGAGTLTATGAGVTRTLTVTGGTPFFAGMANTDIIGAYVVETPLENFFITAFTSSSVVTGTLDDSSEVYVNETSVPYYLYQSLFDPIESADLSTTPSVYTSSIFTQYVSANVGDTLVAAYFARTTKNSRQIYIFYGGSQRVTHIHTPIVVRHNRLLGLQGGTLTSDGVGEYYHLTNTEYSKLGPAYNQANTATTNADAAFTRANAAYANANTAIYTAAQIRANISASLPITYSSATGVISLPSTANGQTLIGNTVSGAFDVATIAQTAPIVVVNGKGTITLSHASSGVTATGYGNAAFIPVFVTDAFGHITSVTNTAITGLSTTVLTSGILSVARGGTGKDATGLANGQILIGNTVNTGFDLATVTQTAPVIVSTDKGSIRLSHARSGVTATTYGSASLVPVITVDDNGHITSATTAAVAGGSLPAATANGQLLIGNTVSSSFDVNTLTQGAGITVTNDKGTITVSSTAAQQMPFPKSIAIMSPAVTDNITFFYTNTAVTFSRVISVVQGSASPNVTFDIRYANTRAVGTVGTSITGPTICTNTTNGLFTTSFTNSSVPANNFVFVIFSSVSGTVTELDLTMEIATAVAANNYISKQVLINFGAGTASDASSNTITDGAVTTNSIIVGSVAYQSTPGTLQGPAKDQDEFEMDQLNLTFAPGAGQFTVYATCLSGLFLGEVYINYTIYG